MLGVVLCALFGCSNGTTGDVSYRVYNGTTAQYTVIPSGNPVELYKNLKTSEYTDWHIPGWYEDCQNASAVAVVSALLSRGGYNVCCLDWSKLARTNYISAATSTQDVAAIFANDISGMYDMGFEPGKMSIRGYSLGAHIAGCTGKNLQATGCPNLGQITALDAGLPLMYPPVCLSCRHLEPSDADIVWAIHTSGGTYGVMQRTAQIDIYPNYGTPIQKGCPVVPKRMDLSIILPTYRCSHDRSWEIFVDAINHPNSHIGVECDSSSSFGDNSCMHNRRISIGMDMPTNISGLYYYMTNAQPPYGRGEQGTNSSNP